MLKVTPSAARRWRSGLFVQLAVLALLVGRVCSGDPGLEWEQATGIPRWMVQGLCYRSDRVLLDMLQHRSDATCSNEQILIHVDLAQGKLTDQEGFRDVLLQVGLLYANCVKPTGLTGKVAISSGTGEKLTPFVRKGLETIAATVGIVQEADKTCYRDVYTIDGSQMLPVDWRFLTSRGVLPSHSDYFAEHGVFVRHPTPVQDRGAVVLREVLSGDATEWRSQQKSVLYVEPHNTDMTGGETVLRKIESIVEKAGGTVTVSSAKSGLELCQEVRRYSMAIILDTDQIMPTVCMRSGSHVITTRDKKRGDPNDHLQWFFVSVLNRLKIRLYVLDRVRQRIENNEWSVRLPTIMDRVRHNLVDAMWNEDQIAFMQKPHP